MAFSRGPKIVTDGLVLYLDAVNTNSYPGSGNTWSDLSGNGNDFIIYNSPTHDGSNFTFDGNNDYIFATLNNPGGDWIHSICFWVYFNRPQSQISSRIDPFQIGNNNTTSQYSALDVSDNNINWYFYSNDVYTLGYLILKTTLEFLSYILKFIILLAISWGVSMLMPLTCFQVSVLLMVFWFLNLYNR